MAIHNAMIGAVKGGLKRKKDELGVKSPKQGLGGMLKQAMGAKAGAVKAKKPGMRDIIVGAVTARRAQTAAPVKNTGRTSPVKGGYAKLAQPQGRKMGKKAGPRSRRAPDIM